MCLLSFLAVAISFLINLLGNGAMNKTFLQVRPSSTAKYSVVGMKCSLMPTIQSITCLGSS